MSRRLSCVCAPRHNSRLHPSIWAGYHNEWKFLSDLSDEFDSSTKGKASRKWRQQAAHPRHGILRLSAEGARITSKKSVQYGYFESCLRASDSPLQSMFSLVSTTDPNVIINIFSYSASCPKSRQRVTMDATARGDTERSDSTTHSSTTYIHHGLQKQIFNMPETPVIVGIDWTPEHITTYVDGNAIRRLENTRWHSPMHICFSLATPGAGSSTGIGSRKWWTHTQRKEVFEIYYVRSWHRYPDHRKLNAPGISSTPTHHLKTTSCVTHRSLHYKKSRSSC